MSETTPDEPGTTTDEHGAARNVGGWLRKAGWSLVCFLFGAIFTGVISPVLVDAVTSSKLGPDMCGSEFVARKVKMVERSCPDAYQRVTNAQARIFIDDLFATSNGTLIDAYPRLKNVREFMPSLSPAEVNKMWLRVERSERIGEVERLHLQNRFAVRVRMYELPSNAHLGKTFYTESVNVYVNTVTVHLEHSSDGVIAKQINLTRRGHIPSGRVNPVAHTVESRSDYYATPMRISDGMSNLVRGNTAWELCQLKTSSQKDEWWAWTYIGFVPHSDLEGGDVKTAGVPMCIYRPRTN